MSTLQPSDVAALARLFEQCGWRWLRLGDALLELGSQTHPPEAVLGYPGSDELTRAASDTGTVRTLGAAPAASGTAASATADPEASRSRRRRRGWSRFRR
jgi:hypothetical protein